MTDYEGFRKAGKFMLDTGVEMQGELSLKGSATSLELYADVPFEVRNQKDIFGRSRESIINCNHKDIFGQFYDRSKVSLINCVIISGPGIGRINNEEYHFCSLFPHFVLFSKGNQHSHLSSSDQKNYRMSFTFDDADIIFNDFHSVGKILKNTQAHLENIFESEGRKITIGDYPQLVYSTGHRELISVDTVFGKITATNLTSRQSYAKGIHIEKIIRLDMQFVSKKTLDGTITTLYDLLAFFEVIAGRPQNISDLTFFSNDKNSYYDFDVYWCKPHQRNTTAESGTSLSPDALIQAVEKPDEFSRVLKNWAEKHEERRNARNRFSTAFANQNSYSIDRLVGAANMFDILPASACPQPVAIPTDLEESRCNARKMFKSLPVSPERDSVLNALGRIGKPSLKRKVRHRAKWITDIVGEIFPEIELVIDQAIDLRNYYVHGTDTKIDYGNNNQSLFFLTDTLEFIFAASDLVEAGWDIAAWIEQQHFHTHPFGRYVVSYRERLEALKKLLPEKV